MSDLSISVILANFNHGRYLGRSVGALLSQEPQPDEILLIDDGSTDDSISIIEHLARSSPRIRVLRNQRNIGVVQTQRRALDLSFGTLVYLAAADDWVMPGFFAAAVDALRRHPQAGIYGGDAIVIDGLSDKTLGRRPPVMPKYGPGFVSPAQARALLAHSDNWLVTGAALIRKDALLAVGGLDPDLGSFADGFAVRKIALLHGLYYEPRIVLTWRVFPTGFSRTTALSREHGQSPFEQTCRKIATDPIFPVGYVPRFKNRWHFATARLAVQAGTDAQAILATSTLNGHLDRRFFGAIGSVPNAWLRRTTMLFWLWLRLRPYRLSELALTFIIRRLRMFA